MNKHTAVILESEAHMERAFDTVLHDAGFSVKGFNGFTTAAQKAISQASVLVTNRNLFSHLADHGCRLALEHFRKARGRHAFIYQPYHDTSLFHLCEKMTRDGLVVHGIASTHHLESLLENTPGLSHVDESSDDDSERRLSVFLLYRRRSFADQEYETSINIEEFQKDLAKAVRTSTGWDITVSVSAHESSVTGLPIDLLVVEHCEVENATAELDRAAWVALWHSPRGGSTTLENATLRSKICFAGVHDSLDSFLSDVCKSTVGDRALAYGLLSGIACRDAKDYAGLIGFTDEMRKVKSNIRRAASSDTSVLINGETGTGKDLVARAIHGRSARRSGQFVACNCAAIPETLAESELFGYESKAGIAGGNPLGHKGKFEQANGGTILLDEIGEMDPRLQAKVLRALEDRKVVRLGGSEAKEADVRVVAATHKHLAEDVSDGKFREDLFFRIYGFLIHVPPLRDRRDDIPLLIQHFLSLSTKNRQRKKAVSPEAMQLLYDYNWPGNVRELKNVIDSLCTGTDNPIGAKHVSEELKSRRKSQPKTGEPEDPPVTTVSSPAMHSVLKHQGADAASNPERVSAESPNERNQGATSPSWRSDWEYAKESADARVVADATLERMEIAESTSDDALVRMLSLRIKEARSFFLKFTPSKTKPGRAWRGNRGKFPGQVYAHLVAGIVKMLSLDLSKSEDIERVKKTVSRAADRVAWNVTWGKTAQKRLDEIVSEKNSGGGR
jgi:DNA-binding NtrC family response regulator